MPSQNINNYNFSYGIRERCPGQVPFALMGRSFQSNFPGLLWMAESLWSSIRPEILALMDNQHFSDNLVTRAFPVKFIESRVTGVFDDNSGYQIISRKALTYPPHLFIVIIPEGNRQGLRQTRSILIRHRLQLTVVETSLALINEKEQHPFHKKHEQDKAY